MTSYAVDLETDVLIRTWSTFQGRFSADGVSLPENASAAQRCEVADALTLLADGLWLAYSHSGIYTESGKVRGRRQQLVDLLTNVVAAVRPSVGMPRRLDPAS